MKTEKKQNNKNKINQIIEQNNEIKKRSKMIKNALRNFKVFYQNVRGLKSKVDSIIETISDYQPILYIQLKRNCKKKRKLGYQKRFLR